MPDMSRRRFVQGAALGAAAFPVAAKAQQQTETLDLPPVEAVEIPSDPMVDLIQQCQPFTATEFTLDEQTQMAPLVEEQLERIRRLAAQRLENSLAPAEVFDPRLPRWKARSSDFGTARVTQSPDLPSDPGDLAYAPAWQQIEWLTSGKLKSLELTNLYLHRIETHDPTLFAMSDVAPELACAQAAECDRLMALGKTIGPLHGLPYVVKDLFDVADMQTAWGATPYQTRLASRDATVVTRLREAGAVLLGQSTCGALAYGDIWYGGVTRNPWNPEEGSSGSSAGTACAVAAGLCSFGIGTETMGSIISPSERCGAQGLRPTFGHVPRTGAMALCWSLDKIGVIARGVDDTQMVLDLIAGPDGRDEAVIKAEPLKWKDVDPKKSKLGYLPEWFAKGTAADRKGLEAAKSAGFQLVELNMPQTDVSLLSGIVILEAAAAFEELTLTDRDDELVWQDSIAWPNSWRAARYETAIGYIQAQRIRRKVMQEFAETIAPVDAIIHPNYAGGMLQFGNHCGYPAIHVVTGLLGQPTREGFTNHVARQEVAPGASIHQVPFGISLTGHLFDEARLVAIARELELQIGFKSRPGLD